MSTAGSSLDTALEYAIMEAAVAAAATLDVETDARKTVLEGGRDDTELGEKQRRKAVMSRFMLNLTPRLS